MIENVINLNIKIVSTEFIIITKLKKKQKILYINQMKERKK